MVRKTYPLIGILLILALALTGYQMAVARAQPVPAGQIVICSGMGLVTVMVDSDGQPVQHSHLCPDGLLTLFNGLGVAWIPPGREQRWLVLPAFAEAMHGAGRRLPAVQARDPPARV
ncbi:hypothetical protein KO516_21075 [Citreicella sp. C3M06]|nr:hypothetical protein [Citreicella sp. C3M06]